MATLALSLAGQFAGALVGGPIGATIGRALGALAGSAVDGMLFGQGDQRPANDIRLQGSSEGGAVPRLYGWSRMAGNIIWARELELLNGEDAGAKAMGASEDEVGASFAVAFCEGAVSYMGRVWADGQLLDTEGLTLRFYRGSEDQLPDGLIEATQGVAPAYRGLCYLVVEQLPLSRLGNRIPQLTVELCRVVGDLETDIRAVTIIPGATEFGYDPVPRVRVRGPGAAAGENTHVSAAVSDWTCSIDQLVALCPNLERVSLVVAWFGDDLRCGTCTIGPRVEAAERLVEGVEWRVAGIGRGDVPVVSSHDGGPAYGGTPSDGSVLAAIADLKARGLAVTLYPMIMMDVPAGNGLPDPYGGAAQASYPWRGRITCDPAPGQDGSPDGTTGAASQVESFATGYRAMVLHYAALAERGGGVDALIIGSEMRGLSTVRGPANSFPFVEALVALAGDVRAVVGSQTKLTYAADWSEYSGYQPEGEKFFHLDPLWASPHIDAVGIDNYMPLADWRDGQGHTDAQVWAGGHDLGYLAGNVAGGEGFDWFYASDTDRLEQARTPITDGAHGEPWVYRFKDLRNWWSQPHHDRPEGVRSPVSTAWMPGSKPIWFTELGCAAVDKGANQPNIFGDPKSAESGRPYFSNGTPDPLIQRQTLRAHQQWWSDPANNPAGMVDLGRIYHWTWDARPYPEFPARTDVWADGVNHRSGHWLTGRLGGMASDELATVVAREHGVQLRAEPAAPLIGGYVLSGTTTARDALEPLLEITGLSLRSGPNGLALASLRLGEASTINPEHLLSGDGPVLSRRRGDPAEAPGRLVLTYLDRERDYLSASVTALSRNNGPVVGEATAMVLDGAGARLAAERMLDARGSRRETLELELPPSTLSLEPGDLIDIAGLSEGPFEITEIHDGLGRKVLARTLPSSNAVATDVDRPPIPARGVTVRAVPVVTIAHLPRLPGNPGQTRLLAGAHADPWPGHVHIAEAATGATVATLTGRAQLGLTSNALLPGATAVWDHSQVLEVILFAGHLASAPVDAVLAASNRLLVEGDDGSWEVLGFADAELVGTGIYRLRHLLRGLDGTNAGAAVAGSRVMVLDKRIVSLPVEPHWLGEERHFQIYGGPSDVTGRPLTVATNIGPALPLSPVHLRAERQPNGDVQLAWTRRSRADGDNWGGGEAPLEQAPEHYRLTILEGSSARRSTDCFTLSFTYTIAQQVADFGAQPAGFAFRVAQVSQTLGPGAAAERMFHD